MDRFFPFLSRLESLRRISGVPSHSLVLRIGMVCMGLGTLMVSIYLWTRIDGLSLGDFFMLCLVQMVVLATAWGGLHCLWLSSRSGQVSFSDLLELGGEVLGLAWICAGLCLFVSGFFPKGAVIFGFFGAFPFLGGLQAGSVGGITGLCMAFGVALFVYALCRTLARGLGDAASGRSDGPDFDDE